MDGLHVYPVMVVGAMLAPALWISRRYDAPLSRQVEIAFLVGMAVLWIGATISLFDPRLVPFRPLAEQDRKSALGIAPSDSRKLYGTQPSESQSSRRAAPDGRIIDGARGTTFNPLPGLDRSTAVYDISAHTVYLPDGTKLEAHSGLGVRLDDPRYVQERMRGATPPHLYELALREQPFHGVQALRLKPVGGGNIYGRAGILAHTYMLGPKGDSNGCVVFKNYNAFLQAFQNGDIKRLFVVAHLD